MYCADWHVDSTILQDKLLGTAFSPQNCKRLRYVFGLRCQSDFIVFWSILQLCSVVGISVLNSCCGMSMVLYILSCLHIFAVSGTAFKLEYPGLHIFVDVHYAVVDTKRGISLSHVVHTAFWAPSASYAVAQKEIKEYKYIELHHHYVARQRIFSEPCSSRTPFYAVLRVFNQHWVLHKEKECRKKKVLLLQYLRYKHVLHQK